MTIRFFSNSAPFPVEIDGEMRASTEHYYQAQKFTDPELRAKISAGKKPVVAKKLAGKRMNAVRPDWSELKDAVMERAVRAKFEQHAALRDLLLSTDEEDLAEAASSDYYWGVGADSSGQNRLGLLLMRVRSELGIAAGVIPAQAGTQPPPVLE